MKIKIAETDKERKQAFHVRTEVFIKEQNVDPDEEMDKYDVGDAIHFVGYRDEDNEPIAAGRMRFVDEYGKLERICIIKSERGKHHGVALTKQMEQEIKKHGFTKAKLFAQTYAEPFYEKLGYNTVSGEFLDAGIPHVTMIKSLI